MEDRDPWLSEDQLARLTRKKRTRDQVAVLQRAGIQFRMVAGRPVVLASALAPVAESTTRPQVRKLA